jgi:hypothetical protein
MMMLAFSHVQMFETTLGSFREQLVPTQSLWRHNPTTTEPYVGTSAVVVKLDMSYKQPRDAQQRKGKEISTYIIH